MKRSKSEIDEELDKPYLSGAYIRSFVKHLTSSRNMREKVEREGEQLDPKPHKKQVRRRLHTRKPYQETMLNMAEARREIVSALRIHRAAKRVTRPEFRESGPDSYSAVKQADVRPDFKDPGPAPYSYGCEKIPAANYSDKCYYSPYSWAAAPPPIFEENVDFVLPSQTLGLNLNLQDFIAAPSSIYSASSPSTSSSPPPSEETLAAGATTLVAELDGTKFMEIGGEDRKDDEFVSSPFDDLVEFPTWLNANESWMEHVNGFCNFQDPTLPCMDIGEIEGMDGDWLA